MIELETSHDVGVQHNYIYNSGSNPRRARIRSDIYSLKITYTAYSSGTESTHSIAQPYDK